MTVPPLRFDELAPELRRRLQPKVDRLGYLGDFFAYAGHQPAALAAFIDFTESLKAGLPFRVTEVVALTVAARTRNTYERVQHERLALANGCDAAWVREVLACRPDDHGSLRPEERGVQRLALAALEGGGHGAGAPFAALVDLLGHEAAVGVLLTIGRYAAHALVANVLELEAPVASPIEIDA